MQMNLLRDNVEWLKKQLGNALIACDIWSEVGLSIAGYNEQPEAVAFFNEVTKFLRRATNPSESSAAMPGMGRFYMVELEGKRFAVVIVCGEYQWGWLVDMTQASLGLVVVVVQQAVKKLQGATVGDD
jgi:hypothetical protein